MARNRARPRVADSVRRTYPTIGAYVLADGIQYGFRTSDLAVDWCTLRLVVPLRPVTARLWAILTTRTHGDTLSYHTELQHTAETIAHAFHSAATTEFQGAYEAGYEAWDRSAMVTFLGPYGEVTVTVTV
jgi:hypothetical protein